jgi:hypothetical protein
VDSAILAGSLEVGRVFDTADQAAVYVLGILGRISDRYNVELGVFIYRAADGVKVEVGNILIGNRTTVPEMSRVPSRAVAGAHTHPRGPAIFSDDDLKWVAHHRRPLYVIAGGEIRACEPGHAACNVRMLERFVPGTRYRRGRAVE